MREVHRSCVDLAWPQEPVIHNQQPEFRRPRSVLGHAFFLEDGAETGNLLEGNLGLVTRRPAAGCPRASRPRICTARSTT